MEMEDLRKKCYEMARRTGEKMEREFDRGGKIERRKERGME